MYIASTKDKLEDHSNSPPPPSSAGGRSFDNVGGNNKYIGNPPRGDVLSYDIKKRGPVL